MSLYLIAYVIIFVGFFFFLNGIMLVTFITLRCIMNIINDLPKKKKNINAEIFIQNQTRVVNIAVNLGLVRPNLLNNFSLAIGRTESPS